MSNNNCYDCNSPAPNQCLDCPPCEDIYSDGECAQTIRLKCVIGGVTIESIDIIPTDTGDIIIKKIAEALSTLSGALSGAFGEFVSNDGKTITVENGIITTINEAQ